MVTLRTPDAPATTRQLWLLHVLTKQDTRGLNITMAEASRRIEEAKHGQTSKPATKRDAPAVASAPTRHVEQGTMPTGQSDMAAIEAHFMANAYPIGRKRAGNETARVDFYRFQCEDCFLGMSGKCAPEWEGGSFSTCEGRVESVSYSCATHEPLKYSTRDSYCARPRGKQCQRKHVDNKCLECGYRTDKSLAFAALNRWASAWYIPTLAERIAEQIAWLGRYTDATDKECRERTERKLAILKSLESSSQS